MHLETYLLIVVTVAWFAHVQYLKARACKDMLALIALQLKCTGRTPCP